MVISNWTFSNEDYKNLKCTAPCSLYSVLLQHKKIEDPFYGLNELKSTYMSDCECDFESSFQIKKADLEKEYIEITFYGLDTLCDIYINGEFVAHTINMHRTYRYDIKSIVQQGKNSIRLHFYSPIEYITNKQNEFYLSQPRDALMGIGHIRKAFYMFGWDWGPRLPDIGIFRDVVVEAYDADKIENVWVRQKHSKGNVELSLTLETRHGKNLDAIAQIAGKKVEFVKGKANVNIKNPKLWWANGYGEQNLYDLDVELYANNEVIDTNHQRIGLRTLTVSTQEDKHGNEFCFVLNGVKIFAMGADYIPQDNIISRVSRDDIFKLIDQCIDVNYNSIRVWGGGYYPSDDFYDACDEAGIIVWQDFMVACANVRLTKSFKEEMVAEAIDNVKRIRNRACLGILCGNNEMEMAVCYWGGFDKNKRIVEDYIELYERVLMDLCAEYAPDTFYWPSSPCSGGGFDNPNADNRGDQHFWEVWASNAPYTAYRDHNFRFCSEFGFQSYPCMKTIRSFCEEKDMNCFSRVMENHQKNGTANSKILSYIADTYLYPSSFENLVYASQLNQAEAIKYGVEHFRRIRGICMGSVYWQINDCWPVASWSSVDYFGRYKALHYFAKKFYAKLSIGVFTDDVKTVLNVSNEQLKNFSGKAVIKVCNKAFDVLYETSTKVRIDALSSLDVLEIANDKVGDIYSQYIVCELYDNKGERIALETALICKPKHFEFDEPEINCEFAVVDEGISLSVSSNTFTKGVYIDFDSFDVKLSDNFFDITDDMPVKVIINTDRDVDELMSEIKIKTVYDIDK